MVKRLFPLSLPDVESSVVKYYKYCSYSWLTKQLNPQELQRLQQVLEHIPENNYRHQLIDYRVEALDPEVNSKYGKWHYDTAPNPLPGPPSLHYLHIETHTGCLTEFENYGQIESNYLYEYDHLALHRAVPAVNPGIRNFIRISCLDHMRPQNRIMK